MTYWWVFWVEVDKYFEDFIVDRCWLGLWVGYSVVLFRITYYHSYKLNCDKSVNYGCWWLTSMTYLFFVWAWNLKHEILFFFLKYTWNIICWRWRRFWFWLNEEETESKRTVSLILHEQTRRLESVAEC